MSDKQIKIEVEKEFHDLASKVQRRIPDTGLPNLPIVMKTLVNEFLRIKEMGLPVGRFGRLVEKQSNKIVKEYWKDNLASEKGLYDKLSTAICEVLSE